MMPAHRQHREGAAAASESRTARAFAALRRCLSRLHPWPVAAPEHPDARLPSLPPAPLQQPITDLLVQQSLRAPLGDTVTLKGSRAWTHPVAPVRLEARASGRALSALRPGLAVGEETFGASTASALGLCAGPAYTKFVRRVTKLPCAQLLRAAHRPIHLVPMRRDLLQRAGSGQSGCFEPLDDLFDLGQPRLDCTELVPNAVQFLRKNFGLGAPGRHRAEPILSLASEDLRLGLPATSRVREARDRVLRAFWLRFLARQASAVRRVRL
jgi:hypothetical protein